MNRAELLTPEQIHDRAEAIRLLRGVVDEPALIAVLDAHGERAIAALRLLHDQRLRTRAGVLGWWRRQPVLRRGPDGRWRAVRPCP